MDTFILLSKTAKIGIKFEFRRPTNKKHAKKSIASQKSPPPTSDKPSFTPQKSKGYHPIFQSPDASFFFAGRSRKSAGQQKSVRCPTKVCLLGSRFCSAVQQIFVCDCRFSQRGQKLSFYAFEKENSIKQCRIFSDLY